MGPRLIIFAINLGQKNVMIASRRVYDSEPLHLRQKLFEYCFSRIYLILVYCDFIACDI